MIIMKKIKLVLFSAIMVTLFFVLQSVSYSQTDTTYGTPGTGSGSGSGMGSGSSTGSRSSRMGADTSGRYGSSFYSKADSLVQNLDSQVSLSDNQKSQIRQILMDLRDDLTASSGRNTDAETGETSGNTSMQSRDKQINDAVSEVQDVLDQNQKSKFSSFRDTWTQEVKSAITGSSSSNSNMNNNNMQNNQNNGSGSGTGTGTGSGSGTDTTGTNRSGY